MAGLIKHTPELCAITNQWVNSYKRLVPGLEAPVFASWTIGDMGGLIRVPSYRPSRESSVRIEYRLPDSATNPYLTYKNKGWVGYGDWLGTGRSEGSWKTYKEAREYVHSLKLKGQKDVKYV